MGKELLLMDRAKESGTLEMESVLGEDAVKIVE